MKNIECLADPGAGEVRIGSGPNIADTLVSAVIETVPALSASCFHLVTADETACTVNFTSVRSTLIARKGGRSLRRQTSIRNSLRSSFVVVAGPESPWARRRRIALAELVNETWCCRRLGPNGAGFDVLRAGGLEQPRIAVFAAPPGAVGLAATGRFLDSPRLSMKIPVQASRNQGPARQLHRRTGTGLSP